MKVSIITTVQHNIGDDFVREGIKHLIRRFYKDMEIKFEHIHKHSPITTRYGFENVRSVRVSNRIDGILPKTWFGDRVIDADILIQSGAPVYWCHQAEGGHCCDNEWYHPLIKKRWLKYNRTAPLINLAAGTCQRYHSDGSEFCDRCNKYIKEFYKYSTVTTVRDSLAKKILSSIGVTVEVIPCTSIFAIDEHGLSAQPGEYVVVNYMKGGGHFTFGQKIDSEKYENEFRKFYFKLKSMENVVISCHNEKEVNEAMELDQNAKIFYKKDDYLAYMKFYAKAKFGFMNRVHGAFMIASYGRPSIIIGNDSRARMVEEIGLKSYFVNEVDCEILMNEYENLKRSTDDYKNKFKKIKDKAYIDYMKEFKKLIK